MRGEPTIARLMNPGAFGRTGPRQRIRGRDFAGTIEAVGPGVTGWQVGDEVLGEAEATFAEYAVVPQGCLARRPEALSFEDAAALPLAATTADLCLTRGGVDSGHRVLVIGASGGVGTFAVLLATALGATVTGVCSTRNVDLVESLGATEVVDYTREDFSRTGAQYDVVLDLVGGGRLRDLRRVVAPGGRLVLSGGGNPGEGRYVGPVGLMAKGGALRAPPRPARAGPAGRSRRAAARRPGRAWPPAAPSARWSSAPTPSPTPRRPSGTSRSARPRQGRRHRLTVTRTRRGPAPPGGCGPSSFRRESLRRRWTRPRTPSARRDHGCRHDGGSAGDARHAPRAHRHRRGRRPRRCRCRSRRPLPGQRPGPSPPRGRARHRSRPRRAPRRG